MPDPTFRPHPIRAGIIIGVSQALVLILCVALITIFTGNQQQKALNDIRSATSAQVCVLLLPVDEHGRDEGQTNSLCLIPSGLQPIDANGNGRVELDGP